MKTRYLLLAIITILFASSIQTQAQSKSEKKMLVIYYSWSNSGNTRNVAGQIKEATGADIFEIVPVNPYPRDYMECVKQARKEIDSDFKPEIKGKVEDFDSYDIIFVGSPNWWSTIAPPVATFLSSYNLKGKVILPFMTHEDTRLGRSMEAIKKLCPDADIRSGLPIQEKAVPNAGNDIQKWLKDNGLKE